MGILVVDSHPQVRGLATKAIHAVREAFEVFVTQWFQGLSVEVDDGSVLTGASFDQDV